MNSFSHGRTFLVIALQFGLSIMTGFSQKIMIVSHSVSGKTQKMAESVLAGAQRVDGVEVIMKEITTATVSDVLTSDAVIVGCPVQNGNPSPEILSFIRSWPFEGWPMRDKIGAVFVTGGGISAGEELAQLGLIQALMVQGMLVVGGGNWESSFGASAVTAEKPFDGATPDRMFLIKAEALGQRVAQAARRWKK